MSQVLYMCKFNISNLIIGNDDLLSILIRSDVDDEKRKVTILSPSPGRLPKKHILMGSFKWMES